MEERDGTALVVETGFGFELLASLVAATDSLSDDGELGEYWFTEHREAVPVGLLDRVARFTARSSWVWGNLLGIALPIHDRCEVPELLRRVASMDGEEVALHLVGYHLRPFRLETPPAVMLQAVRGDAAAIERFVATSFPADARWPEALRALLRTPPAALQDEVLEILTRWHDGFLSAFEADLRAVRERDARRMRALATERSLEDVVNLATNGWDYVPEPGIERVVLVPSVALRPWVLTADHGPERVLVYSVPEGTQADEDAPPPGLVAQLRALGDERRLRILRALARQPSTLGELTDAFGLPKTTLLHHLVTLRSAGLVRLRERPGRQFSPHTRYHVRFEALPRAWEELRSYLALPDDPATSVPPGPFRPTARAEVVDRQRPYPIREEI